MVLLESEIAEYILAHCPARTDEALMPRFGISYNTLRKIEARQPLRRSLINRLKARLKEEGVDVLRAEVVS